MIVSLGSDGDAYFIVMEFINQIQLADIIRREAPLLPRAAASPQRSQWTELTPQASWFATSSRVRPRSRRMQLTKVTDFGIARAAHGDNEQTMTQTGMLERPPTCPRTAQGQPVDGRSGPLLTRRGAVRDAGWARPVSRETHRLPSPVHRVRLAAPLIDRPKTYRESWMPS